MALRQLTPEAYVNVWAPVEGFPTSSWQQAAIVKHGRKRIGLLLSAGQRDDVSIFKEGDDFYVLSVNRGLDYVGLDQFDPRQSVPVDPIPDWYAQWPKTLPFEKLPPVYRKQDDVFLQNEEGIKDVLGRKGLDLTERTMLKRLAERLGY